MPTATRVRVRTGQLDVSLTREEFAARFRGNFYDPAFESAEKEIEVLTEIAWRSYREYHKSPRTVPAGPEFADPGYPLPVEWLDTRRRIHAAQAERARRRDRSRVLIVNGSARNDQTCPGEMSKTHRLVQLACSSRAASSRRSAESKSKCST